MLRTGRNSIEWSRDIEERMLVDLAKTCKNHTEILLGGKLFCLECQERLTLIVLRAN
jgi:hypothetical protein